MRTRRRISRLAQERVESHAREPALVEQRNEARQRAHGCGLEVVVLCGIVKQHNRAGDQGSGDLFHDSVGASPADAVEASRRPADERDARQARAPYARDAGMAERGSEEARPSTRGGFDCGSCPDDLVAHGPRHAERVQAIVGIAVHGDGVTAGVNLAYDAGMPARLLA
jgi:hypothetical protein